MRKEEYEQMEIDVTLQSERDLKDNVQSVVQFAYKQMIHEKRPEPVRNRHEGYGIVAEKFASMNGCMKFAGDNMKTYLVQLSDDANDTINTVSSLYNSAVMIAVSAIKLAAESQRIMSDLYYGEKTPIEQALEAAEDPDDGFQEAQDVEETETEAEAETETETETEDNEL